MRIKLSFALYLALLTFASGAVAKSWRVSGAIVHLRQGEYDQAVQLLEEEIAASPDNAEAYAYLGDAYAPAGRFMEAADAWARAEDLYRQKNKTKKLDKITQSREFFWDKAFKKGADSFKRALKFNDADFTPTAGETVEGDLDAAAAAFVATYRVFPPQPRTLFLLGRVYEEAADVYSQREPEETVTVTDYDLETGAAVEREVKAGVYVDELWEKALVTYEKAVETKRADMAGDNWDKRSPLSDYLLKIVNTCLHLEQYDRALATIDPLLAASPENLMLLNAKAAVLIKLDRFGEALSIWERMVDLVTDEKAKGELLGEIGAFYLRKEYDGRDPKKAIEVLEKAITYTPQDYRIYLALGRAYGEIGEYEKGKEYLEKGEKLYAEKNKGGTE